MSTYNSDHIIESTTEIALLSGWGILKEYLSNMEDYLHETISEFKTGISEQKKTLRPGQRNQFDIDHVWDYIYYYDEFPYILRNSFLVSTYSLFEFDIDIICRKLKAVKKIPINLNNLYGNLLKRLKLYFKLAAVDYSFDNTTWDKINNYSNLRNCIVHRNGLLKEGDKDYKELLDYVKEKGLMKERTIIFDDAAETEIGLTKDFCEEVAENMQKFIDTAYKASITKD